MVSPVSPAGLSFALGSATLYGLNIGYARLSSFAGVSGTTIVFYRVILMLALVGLAVLGWHKSLTVPREERWTIGLLGIATAFVGVFYLSSVAFIPVAMAAVVFYTFPILIVLASPFVEGTPLTGRLVTIVALALFGVLLVVGPAFDDLDWRGVALAFAASIVTATQFFAAARARKTPVLAKIFWIHLLVLPIAAAVGFAAGNLGPPSVMLLAPQAVALTVAGYTFGFLLQFLALGRVSAVVAGIAYCAEPVVAALSATVILDESLSLVQLLGGAVVVVAIVLNVVEEGRVKAQAVVPTD